MDKRTMTVRELIDNLEILDDKLEVWGVLGMNISYVTKVQDPEGEFILLSPASADKFYPYDWYKEEQ